jgi:hypothetical protein
LEGSKRGKKKIIIGQKLWQLGNKYILEDLRKEDSPMLKGRRC